MSISDHLFKDLDKQESILASIRYARVIQNAILSSRTDLVHVFPEHALVYEPRDIVSGDFYYVHKRKTNRLIFVGDCTGHGVPGALMSILCNDLLIRAAKNEDNPATVFKIINGLLKEKFLKNNENYLYDGMDCSLAIIDDQRNNIKFCGAKNDAVLIRQNKTVKVLKSTRRSIGRYDSTKNIEFVNHEVEFTKGDILYFFSDGFQDQVDREGNKLGKKGFLELLAHIANFNDMRQQQLVLNSSFKQFLFDTSQLDDVLVLGVKL